jgi:hypothetical protein
MTPISFGGKTIHVDTMRLHSSLCSAWNACVNKPDAEKAMAFADVLTEFGLPTLSFGTVLTLIGRLGQQIMELQKKSPLEDTHTKMPT